MPTVPVGRTPGDDPPDLGPEPAILVAGLVKRYRGVTAVAGLDLRVDRGETFALLGPNGAGKTTTIECCEGYRRPDEGRVRVLGLDPRTQGRVLRPRVGLMLQEGGVYPLVRPLEILRVFARYYADPVEPEALLDELGLRGVARTRYRDLSGGEQQRLSLALALVGRPEVVFLDEPTAGLDPAARRRTWELLRRLRREQVTVVLSTHLLDEVEELADRVAIIDRGVLVACGTPAALTHGDRGHLRFTATAGLDVADLARAVGSSCLEHRPGVYHVEAAPTPRLVARVTAWLADRDVRIGELRADKSSLEDVFLRLTGDDRPDAPGAGGERARWGGSDRRVAS